MNQTLPGHTLNGISDKVLANSIDNHPSPATDSPATPVDLAAAPDVKIDVDYEQESDVRHEPLPVNPPNGINGDVKMHDAVNGHDVSVDDAQTPGIQRDFSMGSVDASQSNTRSYQDDSDDQREPPAKRARVYSDADMASMTHSASPPPASQAASPAPLPPSTTVPSQVASGSTLVTPSTSTQPLPESSINLAQYRFLASSLRALKKSKDGGPFLRPVDPIALNIPHYTSIIKIPMDLSTIERKLNGSNPHKLDSNPLNPRYFHAEELIADVRLMVSNAVTFNGPEHVVAGMGKRLEELFNKAIKHLPPPTEKPKAAPIVKKVATPPAPPPPVAAPKKVPAPRRPSTSVPVIRRSEPEAIGRPKREIHPPPPKDLPYADVPKKNRKGKRGKSDGNSEQLKFCGKILTDLHRKQYYSIAFPFYEPVDWQKLDIPTYPKVIKKPMDLSTMRKKLENGDYESAQNFWDDFKLMIRNCFTFNPSGTPVNQAGQDLQRVFDEKWKTLPPLHQLELSEDEEEDEEEEEETESARQRQIAEMEHQIEAMKNNLESLKGQPNKKKEKKKEKKEKPPVASTSKAPPKPAKAPSKKKAKKNTTDDDVLTFEQKKDLSESIGKLDGPRLERVIQIIHEGVPEIRDSTEEIELEIDQLPATVLTKLYNYVLRPARQPAQPKRNRTGKGTGTGGLKRKSMDEEKEAEKIRQLEERMALFEPRTAANPPPPRREHDSDHSSDSSSGSDSSGSDSE